MIILAPMEGVVDVHMRDIMTRVGGYDLCVTEFVRVHQALFPASVYYKYCPELKNGCKTAAGTPVFVQLMGNDEQVLAENAAFVTQDLGAIGIDLNFGCPAKIVNRRCAGSALLQWPERLNELVAAVRRAVPDHIPVTAKMRLGYETPDLALENAKAIEEAGAEWLTVHARTKVQGYRPPANWEWIARISAVVSLPVIANGDIWSLEDFQRCREVTGSDRFMLGRGAIARPDLARQIKSFEARNQVAENSWKDMMDLLLDYYTLIQNSPLSTAVEGRMKQWIKLVGRTYPQALELFEQVKRERDPAALQKAVLTASRML